MKEKNCVLSFLKTNLIKPPAETCTSGCHGDFWLKNVILILACDDTITKNKQKTLTPHKRKTPTTGCHGDFWSKGVFLILFCYDTISIFIIQSLNRGCQGGF